MIQDAIYIFINQLNALKKHRNTLLIFVGYLIAIFLFVKEQGATSLIGFQVGLIIFPTLFGSLCGGEFISDTISKEKNENTLEILLSTGISEYSIIIGKVLTGLLVSYTVSLTIILFFKFGFYYKTGNINFIKLSTSDFLNPLIFGYLALCCSIITYLILKDEKFSPFVSILLVVVLLYGLTKLSASVGINIIIVVVFVGGGLCVFMTYLAGKLLKILK